jgi:hypothetical protein
MKVLIIIFVMFIITNCSTVGIASLSSNVVSYSITGKTNADLAISMLVGKDCHIVRIIKKKEVCE